MSQPCYLFDIDGTVADLRHRLHHIKIAPKNWNAFFAEVKNDAPIEHMRTLIYHLVEGQSGAMDEHKTRIVFMSGRMERCRADTEAWLVKHHFPAHAALYMRAEGDYRSDDIVKAELLQRVIADGFKPRMAFDDRDRVVKMWRDNGIPCAQVAEGDF